MKFIIFLALSLNSFGDPDKYVSQSGDFSLMPAGPFEFEQTPTENGYAELFHFTDPKDTAATYVLTIMKFTNAAPGFEYDALHSEDYKTGLLGNCKCTIAGKEQSEFTHIKGVNYKLIANEGGIATFSFSVLKDPHLYAILLQAEAGTIDNYRDEFTAMMNSMEIFK